MYLTICLRKNVTDEPEAQNLVDQLHALIPEAMEVELTATVSNQLEPVEVP